MQNTKNYALRKPDVDDFYSVDDQNTNMDLIDGELKKLDTTKADKIELDLHTPSRMSFTSDEELLTYLNNYSSNFDNYTEYQTVLNVTHSSELFDNNGGIYFVFGFRTNAEYEFQIIARYNPVGVYVACRSKNAGVWGSMVGLLSTVGGTVNGVMISKGAKSEFQVENTTGMRKASLASTVSGEVGIYDITNNKWIVRSDTTGIVNLYGVATGNLPLTGGIMKKPPEPNYGGYITLEKATNSTLGENVMIQTFMNQLRIFVSDTESKGAYLDINECAKSIGSKLLHTGNSAPTIISATAPTDTTALWVDTTAMKMKIYKNSAWTALS